MDCEVEFMREALPTATENGADLALSPIGCVIIMDGVHRSGEKPSCQALRRGGPPAMLSLMPRSLQQCTRHQVVWRHCETTGNRGRTVTRKVNFAYFEIMSRR